MLFHPDITNQDSFHAILLTANNAVHLETMIFPDYQLQRTYAFNATLAEPQGPDGLPVSSRRYSETKLLFMLDCLEASLTPKSLTKATAGGTRPSSMRSVIEDMGVIENEDMQGFQTTGFQTEPGYVPIHDLPPSMFVVMTTKLIELKCEDCLEAFMLTRDYNLWMRLKEGQRSRIIRDLAWPSAMSDMECSQISMYDILKFLVPLFILEDITQGISMESPVLTDSPPPLISFDSSDEEEDETTIIRLTQKLITYPMPQKEEKEVKVTTVPPLQTSEKIDEIQSYYTKVHPLLAMSEESDPKSSMELNILEWPFTNYQAYLDD
ncbi:hypothetical protein ARMGADRAFT_1029423 [Armillaria gallica]|uniref:Uncharacterized protein n=1 Tax=Armillaria gallica TaxID=47427 RepID=A0A2H3DS50_ARMGA|nr:hypothetical protein ARMGADRAFT_1029423 [Armillaria gallica]